MVKLNGEYADIAGKSIAEIVAEGGYNPARVAVELNGAIVPKAKYAETIVRENDTLEVVSFVGGGQMIPSKEDFFNALAAKHGKELQKKFAAVSIAVCGAGGLGSNIAIALARAGVGRLKIIDFDKIEITNLNRQQYFADQIGMFKAVALKENLAKIAPYCEVTAEVTKITEENVTSLLKGFPIVCEAFDKAEAKAMLVNAILENMPETYLVSGSGMASLNPANLIKTRKITDRFYLCGDFTNDVDAGNGLFGARVLVCAAHQAHTVLRIIAGEFDC